MNDDDAELADRQQVLDERERALLEREEELVRQARANTTSSPGGGPRASLDRPPSLVAESPRRSFAFLFVFLAALALLCWMVLRGDKRSGKDEAAESLPFESRKTAGLNLEVPATPSPVPGAPVVAAPAPLRDEAAERLRQHEQELLLARQRAPILITHPAASSARSPAGPGSLGTSPASAELPNLDRLLAVDASRLEAMGRSAPEVVDPNTRFQRQLGKSAAPVSVATRTAGLDFLVLQGKFIDAVAETAINSDLPGQVRALVSYPDFVNWRV